jgi:hypothetical protein
MFSIVSPRTANRRPLTELTARLSLIFCVYLFFFASLFLSPSTKFYRQKEKSSGKMKTPRPNCSTKFFLHNDDDDTTTDDDNMMLSSKRRRVDSFGGVGRGGWPWRGEITPPLTLRSHYPRKFKQRNKPRTYIPEILPWGAFSLQFFPSQPNSAYLGSASNPSHSSVRYHIAFDHPFLSQEEMNLAP